MVEAEILKEDLDNTAPLKTDGLPTADKRRVLLGTILGGGMFLGIIIALIVLVSGEERINPNPKPVPPPQPILIPNPFVVVWQHMQDHKTMVITLFNNRTAMEEDAKKGAKMLGETPIVKNTTENEEPLMLRGIFQELDEHTFNYKVTDPQWERWEVPTYGRDEDPYSKASKQIKPKLHAHILTKDDRRFEWVYHGKQVELLPLISTEHCKFAFYDKYIEFEARIQTDMLFGMGERVADFHLHEGNYSLWNRDYTYEYGKGDTEIGTFSSHPFFLNRLKDKKDFIGVFMRNSNAMLFSYWKALNNGTTVNFKMIGGTLDLYVFHEGDPYYILQKYHSFIGRPYLPPVWGMGLQQARKGYTLQDMKTVVEKYQKHRIPVDALWADVELNDNFKTFTVSNDKFNGLKDFVKKLHDPHEGVDMKFVAITNPGLKKQAGYKYYDKALKDEVLIKSAYVHDKPYEGRTYAGDTVWLDYFVHKGVLVWAEGMHDLYELSNMDGVWISENEPNNLCDGECNRITGAEPKPSIPNPFHNSSEFDYIPFRPTLDILEHNTLPMAAYQCCDDFFYKQYYTHNLFGLQTAQASFDSLYGIFEDKRFLVASRSTWPGSGHYSSHWLAENFASWDSMRNSIAGILNFNMFGIPHVGAPIGGFYGDCSSELLIRWFELACFSPLMLSYSNSNTKPKEAYANEEMAHYIKDAVVERYSLLRWMYTKMFEAHAWGGPVVHPLFFEFPEDEMTFQDYVIEGSFMWSRTLYVIPALIPRQQSTGAWVPNWRWYDLHTLEMVVDYHPHNVGQRRVFHQPLGHITVLIKGGSILPYQHTVRDAKVMNVEDLKKIPVLLIVAPDHTGRASGTMVVDADGIRPHPDPMSHTYRHYAFTYMNQIFRINKLAGFDFHEEQEYDYFWQLIILDVFGQHTIDYVCMMDTDLRKKSLEFWHAHDSNSLIVHDHRMAKMPMFKLESIVWGTADHHDFCKFQVHMESQSYQDEDRTMIGELATSDPESYQLKFDFKASVLTDHIISMQIILRDHGHVAWIVPDVVDDVKRHTFHTSKKISESGFGISRLHEPFHFEIADPLDPHEFTFTTRNLPFVYVRNFMHMKFMVNSRHIFGLGERINKFELADGIYSLWNYDAVSEETGLPPGNNMYGSHPFYLAHLQNPNLFAGVFFLNSNPMDFKIRHVGMQTQIDHIFTGGIIDAFFFQQGTVDEVMKAYHYLIGHPIALPYWSFGYHQSRWGYRDIVHLKDVVNKFEEFNMPLDVIWMDKDYMDNYKVFTIDEKRWYGLTPFVKELQGKGKHFVAIVDAGIAMDESYSVYKDGLERDVYLKSQLPFPYKDKPLVGVTWPGYSVWIDFIHPAAEAFWEDCLQQFYEKLPFDGLWLDMNEPSNFCDGECPDHLHYIYYQFPLDFYDDLYYNPTHRALEKGTVSMEALHYGGTVHQPEFNYHNLYGLLQSRATTRFFWARLRRRPFVISSSTFPGSGRYASHWLGDNYSSWHYMESSIAGIFNFQLFGIPFVGADICGFSGNSTVNLCSRWMQLGAFYPFMRNHNGPNGHPQEPYTDPKLASISRKAIHIRYSLARYIYSEYMHTAHRGGLIFKPVLFEFPWDANTYSILDTTFMFGNAIRVTPVLEDKVDILKSYFPNEDWYEFPSFKKVMSYNHSATDGKVLELHCSLDSEKMNVHVKGGSILSYQDQAMDESITSIMKLLEKPVKLIVAVNHHMSARGNIYYDDEHPENWRTDHHDYELSFYKDRLNINLVSGSEKYNYKYADQTISQVYILNAKTFANTRCAKVHDRQDGTDHKINYEYKSSDETLILTPPKEYKILFSKAASIFVSDQPC